MGQQTVIKLIEWYQSFATAGVFGVRYHPCVFYPTCSEYSKIAIQKYGIIYGLFLSLKRIVRCHPWQKETTDLI